MDFGSFDAFSLKLTYKLTKVFVITLLFHLRNFNSITFNLRVYVLKKANSLCTPTIIINYRNISSYALLTFV